MATVPVFLAPTSVTGLIVGVAVVSLSGTVVPLTRAKLKCGVE